MINLPNNNAPIENTPVEAPQLARKVWSGWPTIGLGLVILVVYFIIQALVAAGFLAAQFISDTTLDPARLAQSISSDGLVISIALILSGLVGLGLIIIFIKVRKNITITEYLGLRPLATRKMLILLAIVFILVLLTEVINNIFNVSQDTGFTVDIYKTSVWPFLLGVAVVIFAPAFEEAFFRGFLFAGLAQSRIGAIGTVILTAVAFAVLHIHYDYHGMVTILVLGIVLGIVRLKTGSLWGSLVMHSFWNFLALIATALYVNGVIK